MLHATPFTKKKMEKEIHILDDEMSSRYDKIHGDGGLCNALVELVNAMGEIRLKTEYGDYLAYTCSALKTDEMNDLIWKIEKIDWQAVADRLRREESTKAEREARRLPTSPTPYLDDVAKAAARLGYDFDLVRYQILAYADRYNSWHSGLKAMIINGDFQYLAERIMEDKASLGVIFQGKPHAQIEMRRVIKIVEKEWFLNIWTEDNARGKRQVKFGLSDKGTQKMKKLSEKNLGKRRGGGGLTD